MLPKARGAGHRKPGGECRRRPRQGRRRPRGECRQKHCAYRCY